MNYPKVGHRANTQLERMIADEKELRSTIETHIDFEEWQELKLTIIEYFRLVAELIDAMSIAERNR